MRGRSIEGQRQPGRRLRRITLVLLTALLGCWAAGSDDASREGRHVRFAWASPGMPATLSLPLPPGTAAPDILNLRAAGAVTVLGFALGGVPPGLSLHLMPSIEGHVVVDALVVQRRSGEELRWSPGPTELIAIEVDDGPLVFERSLQVVAGGLYLAVALQNSGPVTLRVKDVAYLPASLAEGELLYGQAPAAKPLLALLEREFTPATRSPAFGSPSGGEDEEGSAEGAGSGDRGDVSSEDAVSEEQLTPSDEETPDGFGWLPTEKQEVSLEPGESLVLAWSDAALPIPGEWESFVLQPLVSYSTADDPDSLRKLGLPVTVRWSRDEHGR